MTANWLPSKTVFEEKNTISKNFFSWPMMPHMQKRQPSENWKDSNKGELLYKKWDTNTSHKKKMKSIARSPQMESLRLVPKDLLGDAMGQRDLPVAISMMRTIKGRSSMIMRKLSES